MRPSLNSPMLRARTREKINPLRPERIWRTFQIFRKRKSRYSVKWALSSTQILLLVAILLQILAESVRDLSSLKFRRTIRVKAATPAEVWEKITQRKWLIFRGLCSWTFGKPQNPISLHLKSSQMCSKSPTSKKPSARNSKNSAIPKSNLTSYLRTTLSIPWNKQ